MLYMFAWFSHLPHSEMHKSHNKVQRYPKQIKICYDMLLSSANSMIKYQQLASGDTKHFSGN
jgi:hypothetical protein